MNTIKIKKLHPEVPLPTQAYGNPVGFDISAWLLSESGRIIQALIPPRTSKVIPTGLIAVAPKGYFLQMCSRSGIAAQNPPVFVANSPGIIDPDYRGELKVILFNGGHESVYVKHGDRIAQLVVTKHERSQLEVVEALDDTERGTRGFGSTGN